MDSGSGVLQPSRWLASFGNYLYSIAFFKTGNKEIAEDLVQETFLAAIKAKDSFKGESTEKTWLTAILNNKIIDFYRKKDVLKDSAEYLSETDSGFHQNFFESVDAIYGHWKADTAPKSWDESADDALNRGDFNRVLEYCIGKMPSRLMPVFVAKYVDDKDSEEICKELGISPSNYWVILHRAKVLMRSCLERNWIMN